VLKNRTALEIEAVVERAIEQPGFGQLRVANELALAGFEHFTGGGKAHCGSATIWRR
jgi:hypothetical protein